MPGKARRGGRGAKDKKKPVPFWGLLAIGWAIGIASTLGYTGLTGGWYEYYHIGPDLDACRAQIGQLVATSGWEPVPERSDCWLRRPRLRIDPPSATATPLPPTPTTTPVRTTTPVPTATRAPTNTPMPAPLFW